MDHLSTPTTSSGAAIRQDEDNTRGTATAKDDRPMQQNRGSPTQNADGILPRSGVRTTKQHVESRDCIDSVSWLNPVG
eukprot:3797495-Prymnesium_polylepis.3